MGMQGCICRYLGHLGTMEWVCLILAGGVYIYIYILVYIYILIRSIITTSLRPSPGIMVYKGNHPQMALIQVSEILNFVHITHTQYIGV